MQNAQISIETIPVELQIMVAKLLDKVSRNNLKAASKTLYEIENVVPSNNLDLLIIDFKKEHIRIEEKGEVLMMFKRFGDFYIAIGVCDKMHKLKSTIFEEVAETLLSMYGTRIQTKKFIIRIPGERQQEQIFKTLIGSKNLDPKLVSLSCDGSDVHFNITTMLNWGIETEIELYVNNFTGNFRNQSQIGNFTKVSISNTESPPFIFCEISFGMLLNCNEIFLFRTSIGAEGFKKVIFTMLNKNFEECSIAVRFCNPFFREFNEATFFEGINTFETVQTILRSGVEYKVTHAGKVSSLSINGSTWIFSYKKNDYQDGRGILTMAANVLGELEEHLEENLA